MSFDGLCMLALILAVWLFMTAIDDIIELDKQKSNERREKQRIAAYANLRKKWLIRKNRRELWQEVNENVYNVD